MFRAITNWFNSSKSLPPRKRRLLRCELLEDRLTPANFVVTTLADPEPPPWKVPLYTLRQALIDANASGDESNGITFVMGLSGSVNLQDALPHIGEGATIAKQIYIDGRGEITRVMSGMRELCRAVEASAC